MEDVGREKPHRELHRHAGGEVHSHSNEERERRAGGDLKQVEAGWDSGKQMAVREMGMIGELVGRVRVLPPLLSVCRGERAQ